MKRKAWAKFACVTLALAMAAGCGKGDSEKIASPAPAQKTDDKLNSGNPLNLKLYNWGVLSDEEYEQLLMKPLSQKYPNVKLEMIMRDSNMKPENIAVSGLDLDIYAIQSGQVSEFVTYDLLEDVTPFLAKHKMSLDKFKPQYIDLVRGKTKDSIMGIPFGAGGSTPWALVYNKDIFDKFAVPYPKDGMMWDDVYELAKKLTRLDNGVQYKGLDFQNVVSLGSPLGAFSVDPKTEKSSMNTPEWAKHSHLAKKLTTSPETICRR